MKTLMELFEQRSEEFGNKICVKEYDAESKEISPDSLTYRQLFRLLVNKSRLLTDAYGLGKGDTIAVMAENSLDYLILAYSAVITGVQVLLISTRTTQQHLAHFIDVSGCKYLFTSRVFENICSNALASVAYKKADKCRILDLAGFTIEPGHQDNGTLTDHIYPGNYNVNDNDIAFILHTSGTTRQPKLIRLSNRNILTNQLMVDIRINQHWTKDDSTLSWLPLYHCYGFLTEFLRDIYAGSTFILYKHSGTVNVNDYVTAIEKTGVSIVCCVPWMLNIIHENIKTEEKTNTRHILDTIKSLKYLITAGSKLSQKLVDYYHDAGIHIVTIFGMTEAAGAILISDLEENNPGLLKPLDDPGIGFSVSEDINDTCPEKELVFKGSEMVSDSATEQYPGGSIFRTGDLFKEDENGWTYAGRNDQVYNGPQGEKINPMHFEFELEKHELVKKVFVFGEDMHFNMAIVEPADAVDDSEKFTDEIFTYINEQINPELEAPARVYRNDIVLLKKGQELPLTPKGSVNRFEALKIFSNLIKRHRSAELPDGDNVDIAEVVRDEIKYYLKNNPGLSSAVSEFDETTLAELGFDSLMLLSLRNSLTAKLGVSVPVDMVLSPLSASGLVHYLQQSKTGSNTIVKEEPGDNISRDPGDDWRNITLEQAGMLTTSMVIRIPVFSVSISLLAPEKLGLDDVKPVIEYIESKHEILRSIYRLDGKYKIIKDSFVEKSFLGEICIDGTHDLEKNLEFQETVRGYHNVPYDLINGPGYRFALIHIRDHNGIVRTLIFFAAHHALVDYKSLSIIGNEIMGWLDGNIDRNKVVSDRYPEVIPQITTEELKARKEVQVTLLQKSFASQSQEVLFPEGNYSLGNIKVNLNAIESILKKHNISVSNGIFTIWVITVYRYLNLMPLVNFIAHTPITTRNSKELENVVGYFTTSPVLKFELDESYSMKDSMSVVQADVYRAVKQTIEDPYKEVTDNIKNPVMSNVHFSLREPMEKMNPGEDWVAIENNRFKTHGMMGVRLEISASADGFMEGNILLAINVCNEDTVDLLIRGIEKLSLQILEDPSLEFNPFRVLNSLDISEQAC